MVFLFRSILFCSNYAFGVFSITGCKKFAELIALLSHRREML